MCQYLKQVNLLRYVPVYTLDVCHVRNKSENAISANTTPLQNSISGDKESKQYFLKENPDVFGTLSTAAKDLLHDNSVDDGDFKEETFLETPVSKSKKLRTKQYADIIKAHIRKREIKEAIDVLEVRMIKEDRVKPESYIYNLVLGACGRVGYTKMAFKLYNDMKKRGLKPAGGTYTALFNACANSPWIEDGLSRATKLRQLLIEKREILNDTNYNAMIKAFGRCGDIQTAFALVDEMTENKIPLKEETLNFLLQSCISDNEAGFRHALLVWRKFHQKNITPNIFSFNLMLRCIRDCNLGDSEVMDNLLKSQEFQLLGTNNSACKKLVQPNNQVESNQESMIEGVTEYNHAPNLMAAVPHLGNLIQLSEITKAEDRLLLVGGYSGFLKNMQHFKITPDIKTYTQLLDCIPSTLAAEKALLSTMKKAGIKPDVDFLNMLIKKRSMRFDYLNAKDVTNMFIQCKLRPDIISYGVLALGCQNKEQANSLLKEMKDAGYRANIEILGAMLKQACIQLNFVYVIDIMELAIEEQIHPNKIFIQHLEDLYKRCKKESAEKKGTFFTKGFRLFRMRYKSWLEEINIDNKEDVHPWTQFRQPTETNTKRFKWTTTQFKQKITSRYRQKTGALNK
ncbi:uncharacterized protein CBL_09270 [Carabus blaptoides fortunei]